MNTIWKFAFETNRQNLVILMPKGAKIISCLLQNETIMLWALVDTFRDTEQRKFRVFNTGERISDKELKSFSSFIGTVMTSDGAYVYHIYETNE